jgi:hypothetical protein
VHADLLRAHPGQVPAEAVPQVVVAAVGDAAAVAVAQQLPVRWRAAFPGVPEQGGHQGGRDWLPPDGLAFLAQQDQALLGIEILRAQRQCAAAAASGLGVQAQQQRVQLRSSPVVAAAWLISASRLSATALRVEGRRRGFSTFRAGLSAGSIRLSSSACLYMQRRAAMRCSAALRPPREFRRGTTVARTCWRISAWVET